MQDKTNLAGLANQKTFFNIKHVNTLEFTNAVPKHSASDNLCP